MLPGGATVLSTGKRFAYKLSAAACLPWVLVLLTADNTIKAWDVLSGGKLLHTFGSHAKVKITWTEIAGNAASAAAASAASHCA